MLFCLYYERNEICFKIDALGFVAINIALEDFYNTLFLTT